MMADPRIPLFLTVRLAVSDDLELTCIVCGRDGVTHEILHRVRGHRTATGIHVDCASSAGEVKR